MKFFCWDTAACSLQPRRHVVSRQRLALARVDTFLAVQVAFLVPGPPPSLETTTTTVSMTVKTGRFVLFTRCKGAGNRVEQAGEQSFRFKGSLAKAVV
ncbi:hypothetical protein BaRGS_00012314 [Batillaria attramentaria]|uniref:Uncharacterized protein n=1 Tax=Batillaria attramentaria TaxID=370345 RepID=A0ABD0LBI5_9CAEN